LIFEMRQTSMNPIASDMSPIPTIVGARLDCQNASK
jgi:hypothetical protein